MTVTKIKPLAKPKRNKHNYIDNKKFAEAFRVWKQALKAAEEAGLPEPRVPEYIGSCIYLIAINLAKAPNFANYSYKEEMIGDGIENSLMYIKNFDPTRQNANPFAYFTQIIYYAFLRRINKEKKQTYIKHKAFVHDMTFNNLVHGESSGGDHFDSVKITYDPEKMQALEDLFEKPKKVAPKKKTGLEEAMEEEQ